MAEFFIALAAVALWTLLGRYAAELPSYDQLNP
jgi:hypothetical protein